MDNRVACAAWRHRRFRRYDRARPPRDARTMVSRNVRGTERVTPASIRSRSATPRRTRRTTPAAGGPAARERCERRAAARKELVRSNAGLDPAGLMLHIDDIVEAASPFVPETSLK